MSNYPDPAKGRAKVDGKPAVSLEECLRGEIRRCELRLEAARADLARYEQRMAQKRAPTGDGARKTPTR